jgi:hypothetical protein
MVLFHLQKCIFKMDSRVRGAQDKSERNLRAQKKGKIELGQFLFQSFGFFFPFPLNWVTRDVLLRVFFLTIC